MSGREKGGIRQRMDEGGRRRHTRLRIRRALFSSFPLSNTSYPLTLKRCVFIYSNSLLSLPAPNADRRTHKRAHTRMHARLSAADCRLRCLGARALKITMDYYGIFPKISGFQRLGDLTFLEP